MKFEEFEWTMNKTVSNYEEFEDYIETLRQHIENLWLWQDEEAPEVP